MDRVEPPLEQAANLTFWARTLLKLDEPEALEESEAGRRYLEGIRHLWACPDSVDG